MWKIIFKFVLSSLIKSLAKEVQKTEKHACKCDKHALNLRTSVEHEIRANKKKAVTLRNQAATANKQKEALKALGF